MYEHKKQKILIADDSEINRTILVELLEEQYDIAEVDNGAKAVAFLEEHASEISLILLDIVMPEMDGFEVLAFMNKYHWIDDIAVIMISSENVSSYINRAYDFGATDFINRPFDAAVVRRRVNNTMLLAGKQRRLEEIVTDQIYEKEKSSRLMISILSHIVEFRNGESGLHVLHINNITDMVLKHLIQKTDRYPLTLPEITMISTASALHDIGKIAIPEKIINKPGRLTAEEFDIMKSHSMIGSEMLYELPEKQREEPLVKAAYEICRWHHERYDGGGYPDGLVGDQIPISAQVVALADVYDVLTSERCYKAAYSHETAMNMILSGQCGAFNPILLECFQELGERLKEEAKLLSFSDNEERSIRNMAEEVQRYDLSSSNRLFRQLEYERQRFQFLFSSSDDVVFTYTVSPPVLNVNERGMSRLGLNHSVVDPLHQPDLPVSAEEGGLDRLRESLRAATPDYPTVIIDMQLKTGEESRWYHCICSAIWSNAGDENYTGVVGSLRDISEQYGQKLFRNDFCSMTGKEVWVLMKYLEIVFDTVRLVDATVTYQLTVTEDGKLEQSRYHCYATWNRGRRCENCISAKCLFSKSRLAKFEFVNDEIYHVFSIYVEVDGRPYALEMVSRITDDTLISGYGKEELVKSISSHNSKLYMDPVTGIRNRRYYDEQLSGLWNIQGVALIDVDNFKNINDCYGHLTGDMALRLISKTIYSCLRKTDVVVRYGGDEFVIVFQHIPKQVLEQKLEEIRLAVHQLVMEECPKIRFSVSIGGVFGPGKTNAMLRYADRLMYQAKAEKNYVVVQNMENRKNS